MADLGDIVAANVRGYRARNRWRQVDLAERIGWSADTVRHIESGRRRVAVEDLPALCEALGVDLAQLLDGADAQDITRLGI